MTLTVRDTGTTPFATATLTVRPGTVAQQHHDHADRRYRVGLHAGDLLRRRRRVVATISQGGIPLAARAVRFDVVNGTPIASSRRRPA